MNDRRNAVDVTTKHSRSVTLPRRRQSYQRVADGHVPDEVYASTRDHFSEEELVNLTIAVIATNGWNRLNIAFRPEAGEYRPGMFDQPKTAQAAT